MLAWILAVSSFDKFLTQLTDTVKNVSSAYCRKLVTVSKIKVAHTSTGRLYTSKKELWMLGFGCSVLLLCTYLSLKFGHKPLESIQKQNPTCCSTTQITYKLILLLQRQDTLLSRCLIWLWKEGLLKIVLDTYLEGVMTLSSCALKRLTEQYMTWNRYILWGNTFPVTHRASAEQANVYQ